MPSIVRKIQRATYAPRKGSGAASVRALRNDSVPYTFALHDDVLCLVFEELLGLQPYPDSFRGLAAARLVCSAWNGAILSCPTLWRHIAVVKQDLSPAPRFLSTLRLLLGRSGACPLTVILEFIGPRASPALCLDICAALSEHIGRVESFSIACAGAAQALALGQLDPARAPLLQVFELVFEPQRLADGWYAPLAPGLFAGRTKLRLAYTGLAVLLRPEVVSLAALRTLVLADVEFVLADLVELLGLCTGLEDLTLRGPSFPPNGDPLPQGELELAVPLRRLELNRVPEDYPLAYTFIAALKWLPLSRTSVVEIGHSFPFWDEVLVKTTVLVLLKRLPVLDTLNLTIDEDEFWLDATTADDSHDRMERIVNMPDTSSKMALRCVQHFIRTLLGTALFFEPLPAFARLTKLCLPLSFTSWRDIHTIPDALPHVVDLGLIYDFRSFDDQLPTFPRFRSLRTVRLLRPYWRQCMILTVDKVAKLLAEYRLDYRPLLILRGVQIIMLEHDLDRFVAGIYEDE